VFVLGLKGPVSPGALKRFANDLGGALFAPFSQSEAGNWAAPINDHFMQRALGMANRHGLVVLGVRAQRHGSVSLALPDPALHFLGATITDRGTSPAAEPEQRTPDATRWDRDRFTDAALDALDRAAAQAATAGSTLDTRRVFLALEGSDIRGQWERLWLETGNAAHLAALPAVDPEPESDGEWQEVALTRTCSRAVTGALGLARDRDLEPVPVGLLAFGLVADPTSAAAQVLSAHGLTRPAMLELLREITTLTIPAEDLNALARGPRTASIAADDEAHPTAVMPDDGGLLHLLAATPITSPDGSGEASGVVTGLCGRSWTPAADGPQPAVEPGIPCPRCRAELAAISERLETDTEEYHWSPFRTEQVLPIKDGHVQTGY
jgi:hypothetical protein